MFNKNLDKYKIILATGSPRRQKFFKEFGLQFEIQIMDIDESYPDDLKAEKITEHIAIQKANAYTIAKNELLITSDTIVWFEDQAIGKPKDYDDAFQILKRLSNNTHTVFTSVCFATHTNKHLITDKTQVTFSTLTDEMITYYLDHFKPFDKAGAYGIQEWIGTVGITTIDGNYNNIVGFPTQKVFEYLMRF